MATIDTSAFPMLSPTSAGEAANTGSWWRWIRRQALPSTSPRTRGGRVLLISYQFPPTGGSGVQRPAKLAKYLPAFGWSVEVLAAGHERFPWSDASLLEDLTGDTRVHRVAGYEPACLARRIASAFSTFAGTDARGSLFGLDRHGRWSSRNIEDALFWRLTRWANRLGLDQGESMWIGPAVRAAVQRNRETPFDAVISTGPPHFVHRAAMRIARTIGVPWLADLRDPLVSDFDRRKPSQRQVGCMQRLESEILTRANAVVTTCPSFARDLQERYPQHASSIRAITNGFDRDDILAAVGSWAEFEDSAESCEFVAAGSFYGRRELGRIIQPLQQALHQRPEWRKRVRLTIAGTIDTEQREYWRRNKPEWVTLTGYLNHAAAIRLAAAATCNILVVPACEHGSLSIPGKTFELLALPVHILAMVPPWSDTGQIVNRAGASSVVAFEQPTAVTAAMSRIIEGHLSGQLVRHRDWNRVDAFDRQLIAGRFADSLNEIVDRTPALDSTEAAAANNRKVEVA